MNGLSSFFNALCASKVKSRASLFAAGLISALAFAPYFQVWLLFICLPFFILVADRQSSLRSSFFAGWWFGFGHFLAGLYWISISLLVEPEKFAWLIPFAVSLIPAILAIFTGLIAVLLKRISMPPAAVPFLFALLWSVAEWLRGHLFTGFPWNLIGYSWNNLEIMQSLSLVGIYGLGFFTALAAASPVVFLLKEEKKTNRHFAAPVLSIITFFAAFLFGGDRLQNNPTTYSNETWIRIVQPNIPEADRVNPEKRVASTQELVRLSAENLPDKIKIILWPEAALPFLITGRHDIPPEVWKLTEGGRYIITGADRAVGNDWNSLKVWNSVFVLGENGIAAYYDKSKLVPFGEYIPMRKYLPVYINKITPGAIDFSEGAGSKILEAESLPPVLPLICYEAIYPDYVMSAKNMNFLWMANVTNDSWFGNSSGPYQHLVEARARAIESGIPLLRAANTGVSAAFDSYGRILAFSPLGKQSVIDIQLPEKSTKPIVYYQGGDVPFWFALTIGFAVVIMVKVRCLKSRT